MEDTSISSLPPLTSWYQECLACGEAAFLAPVAGKWLHVMPTLHDHEPVVAAQG